MFPLQPGMHTGYVSIISSSLMAQNLTLCHPNQCDIDQDLVVEAAELMVSLGLKDVGYEYVNIDVRPLPSRPRYRAKLPDCFVQRSLTPELLPVLLSA